MALVLVSLAACGLSEPKVHPSGDLRRLLLTQSDYPDGYELEQIDHSELNDPWSSWMPTNEFDEVTPTECAEYLDSPVEQTADSYNLEGHSATKGDSPEDGSVFSHVLMDGGDVGEAPVRTGEVDDVVSACSDASVTVDGEEGDMRLALFELEKMPQDFLGLSVAVSVDQVDITVYTAVTTVDDVMITTTEVAFVETPRFSVPDLPSPNESPSHHSFQDFQEEREEREAEEAVPDEDDLAELQDLMVRSVEKVREG